MMKKSKSKNRAARSCAPSYGSAAGVESEVCKTCYGTGRMDKRQPLPNSEGTASASGSAHINRLYKAVQNYVEKSGGNLVVIGGISVQEWSSDNAMTFHVAVKCSGRKPSFVEPNIN